MTPRSSWAEVPLPRFPALDRDLSVDVAVIGGGITGITAAWLLQEQGCRVALLERQRCARVDTGSTTAHLTAVTDERLHALIGRFGKDRAQAVWDAGIAAIDRIYRLSTDNGISCDFTWVPGYLHSARRGDAAAKAEIMRELAAAESLGIPASLAPEVPLFRAPGALFPHQALFHPYKYLAGLLRRMPGSRCQVFEQSAAEEVLEKPSAVKVNGHRVRCGWVVLATHNPLMGRAPTASALLFQTKLSLYTSYAVGGSIPPGSAPAASYWDTASPYHYLRVDARRTGDYAILGGEDHKTGQGDEAAAYRKLESYWGRLFPRSPLDHRWAGQVIETNDGLPYIGATAQRQFAATGFAGNGMTFGTLGAIMACDAVLGRPNPWSGLFDPRRKKLRGGTWRYIRENMDYPYFMARGWLARADAKDLNQVRPGTGAIVRLKGKKVAAYRGPAGELRLCSPVCTHLQCIVGWNQADQTWDCPCHGSRFRPTGEVISGPAEQNLERLPAPRG